MSTKRDREDRLDAAYEELEEMLGLCGCLQHQSVQIIASAFVGPYSDDPVCEVARSYLEERDLMTHGISIRGAFPDGEKATALMLDVAHSLALMWEEFGDA